MTKSLEEHIAELQATMNGPSGRYWSFNPAVSALIAALEQAQQQNKELESTLEREREKSRRVMSRNQQLEASQLAVNLPEPLSMLYRDSFEKCYVAEKAYRYSDVIEAIRAAGGAVTGD